MAPDTGVQEIDPGPCAQAMWYLLFTFSIKYRSFPSKPAIRNPVHPQLNQSMKYNLIVAWRIFTTRKYCLRACLTSTLLLSVVLIPVGTLARSPSDQLRSDYPTPCHLGWPQSRRRDFVSNNCDCTTRPSNDACYAWT